MALGGRNPVERVELHLVALCSWALIGRVGFVALRVALGRGYAYYLFAPVLQYALHVGGYAII